MERRDEKLPGLRHGFQSAAAEAIGIHRNAAPAEDAETLLIGGGFDGGLGVGNGVGREKSEAEAELFREFDSLFGGFGFEEILWVARQGGRHRRRWRRRRRLRRDG